MYTAEPGYTRVSNYYSSIYLISTMTSTSLSTLVTWVSWAIVKCWVELHYDVFFITFLLEKHIKWANLYRSSMSTHKESVTVSFLNVLINHNMNRFLSWEYSHLPLTGIYLLKKKKKIVSVSNLVILSKAECIYTNVDNIAYYILSMLQVVIPRLNLYYLILLYGPYR